MTTFSEHKLTRATITYVMTQQRS